MRHHCPIIVKRLAPLIGHPESKRRIAVEYQAYTLDEALQRYSRKWPARTALWIERRGQPATLPRSTS